MITAKTNVGKVAINLNLVCKRMNRRRDILTNEGARRLQKYIQKSIDDEGHKRTGVLRSINRGGIHKKKLARGSYQVYMRADYAGYVNYGTSRGLRGSHYFEKGVKKFEGAYKSLSREWLNYIFRTS